MNEDLIFTMYEIFIVVHVFLEDISLDCLHGFYEFRNLYISKETCEVLRVEPSLVVPVLRQVVQLDVLLGVVMSGHVVVVVFVNVEDDL